MKHRILIILAAAVLIGCSTPSSLTPEMQADLVRPIYCEGASECKTMWKRALRFVQLNAGSKIHTANAALIKTKQEICYTNYCSNKTLAMRVTKAPRGNGRYQILTNAWCYRTSSCIPNAEETLWRAQLFIREGIE
jgi:hypothetical protein